ncbi:response regulator transcription factor [Sporolactobacillus terrae]|uniref:DNA-binding response regulator n=1 Tax=Sporolactobacillus terrae TaxID=269673 RepID=A0A410D5J6_9BACL|nr:response regulator transcription factor [Sporolactobacillus terrae]QAA21370.1 DNA-binding response regulator [Sporolactobacillus terrae]QAA24342.1 DNA-binding response regulator [Sporolactobacillus terrae]UAK16162.1 response regulator transcription factor [Sporolactobacillus terrae]BBN97617.1 DNA-binding response regulator [Sporolactobacillus terrae]
MKKLQVLVVDDDWKLRNLLRIYLVKEGFGMVEAVDGNEALMKLENQSFDLVVLDVMMPQMDGWQVCQWIREKRSVPILMLTALGTTKDKVQGLGLGADDYLTKPFDPEELIARVHALIRRASAVSLSQAGHHVLDFPDLTIDSDGRQVCIYDQPIELTNKEFDLFSMLAENSGRVLSREQLIEKIWGYEFEGDTRVVDLHIKNIREKLKDAGLSYSPIQTAWGVGYKFNPKDRQA